MLCARPTHTTGSVVADRSGFPRASVYAMTKGAVASMTRDLARDLGRRGITVNVIQPGPTDTDINDESTRAMVRPLMALGRTGKDTENGARCLKAATRYRSRLIDEIRM
jgi:3-oxoacyl-[acyl-carrier protein] reductase